MSVTVDSVFREIPKNSTFFLIWRIEKLQVVAIPREQYGTFYSGDSYIVACATEGREQGNSQLKPKEVRGGNLDIHIHFWLGSETSQDEAGIAAYKTVELDDYLGGFPVQHREVQGYESKKFISYFRDGIRLLKGGVASGLHHVDHSIKPRLYQIKGKRRPLVRELSSISWEQTNDGDVFVLDIGTHIFLWTGQYANNMEKIQGAKVAHQIKGEHGTTCQSVVVVEDNKEHDSLSADELKKFEEYLPLDSKQVKSHNDLPPDDILEAKQRSEIKLFRCSDEDGTLKVTEVKVGPLEQQDLNSMDSFIIDNGVNGIWVWVGKKATAKERMEAMRNAQGFIKKKGYPNYTPVTRVVDGGESVDFKSLFRGWKDLNQTTGLGRPHSIGKVAKILPEKFDVTTLHENHVLASEVQMVDDGSGRKEIFRVKQFDLTAVDERDYGKFYSGDCYIVIYTYSFRGGREDYIIYYWLGSKSTPDEQGTAALKTVEIDNTKYNGRAVQVRVTDGKEPPHFMAIFGGKMIVYQGGYESGFNNHHQAKEDESITAEKHLLQVRGTNEYNTKAVQVDCRAASLNSNDVFVLNTPEMIYIWAGKGSTGDEREMAKRIASVSTGREIIIVSEGQEKDDFWNAIGGKEAYSSDKKLQIMDDPHNPRLFQCSNANGRFTIEEIVDFNQKDLIEEDVMLLDAWEVLFIWIGEQSNLEEAKLSFQAAQEYLKTDPSGRDSDVPIVVVKQGYEPLHFTGFFGAWNRSLWSKQKCFDEIRRDMFKHKLTLLSMSVDSVDFDDTSKYPLEKLQIKDPILLPDDVNPNHKELYLSADDFHQVFNMTYKEFQALPRWKQVELKKKVGLF